MSVETLRLLLVSQLLGELHSRVLADAYRRGVIFDGARAIVRDAHKVAVLFVLVLGIDSCLALRRLFSRRCSLFVAFGATITAAGWHRCVIRPTVAAGELEEVVALGPLVVMVGVMARVVRSAMRPKAAVAAEAERTCALAVAVRRPTGASTPKASAAPTAAAERAMPAAAAHEGMTVVVSTRTVAVSVLCRAKVRASARIVAWAIVTVHGTVSVHAVRAMHVPVAIEGKVRRRASAVQVRQVKVVDIHRRAAAPVTVSVATACAKLRVAGMRTMRKHALSLEVSRSVHRGDREVHGHREVLEDVECSAYTTSVGSVPKLRGGGWAKSRIEVARWPSFIPLTAR